MGALRFQGNWRQPPAARLDSQESLLPPNSRLAAPLPEHHRRCRSKTELVLQAQSFAVVAGSRPKTLRAERALPCQFAPTPLMLKLLGPKFRKHFLANRKSLVASYRPKGRNRQWHTYGRTSPKCLIAPKWNCLQQLGCKKIPTIKPTSACYSRAPRLVRFQESGESQQWPIGWRLRSASNSNPSSNIRRRVRTPDRHKGHKIDRGIKVSHGDKNCIGSYLTKDLFAGLRLSRQRSLPIRVEWVFSIRLRRQANG